MKPTPQELGRSYEAEVAARYGGTTQPASGAGPRFKLDCKLGALLASVKRTTHRSYRLTAEELLEALAGAQGPGGRGEHPVMIIRMDGFPDDVWVVPGATMHALLEEGSEITLAPSKRSAKIAAARQR